MHEPNPQAFISYSRADWHYVEKLARAFRGAGISTWVDIENMRSGDHWEPAIRSAIRASRVIVFCISPLCIESGRTFRELETALALGLIIFPVMIEPTPIESLPEELKRRHIVQLFRDPPSLACKRSAEQLARALGLPPPANMPDLIARDTIDALILRIGAGDPPVAAEDFLLPDWDSGVIVDRNVMPLDGAGLSTIAEWLNRCSAAYIVLEDAPAREPVALVSGLAFAILGARRVNFVCTADSRRIAIDFAHLMQTRLIECRSERTLRSSAVVQQV